MHIKIIKMLEIEYKFKTNLAGYECSQGNRRERSRKSEERSFDEDLSKEGCSDDVPFDSGSGNLLFAGMKTICNLCEMKMMNSYFCSFSWSSCGAEWAIL